MSRWMRSTCTLFFLAVSYSPASAQPQKPAKLIIAYEDDNSFPWVFDVKGKPEGLDIELMRLLEKELSVQVVLVKYPWKRCLAMMEKGAVDGVIGSSFQSDRLSMGAYPVKRGFSSERTEEAEIDETKRLHTSGYSLYRRKGAKAEWDGKAIKNLGGKGVASQLGFSITADIKALDVPVIEVAADPERMLQGLLKGEFAAAAVQTSSAQFLLSKNKEYAEKIEKCNVDTVPFHQKPYYLMLSKKLIGEYPELSREIWRTLESVRESAVFKARSKLFFQQYIR